MWIWSVFTPVDSSRTGELHPWATCHVDVLRLCSILLKQPTDNRCVLTMSVASALYWQQVRTHDERSQRPLLTTGAYSRWAWRAPSTDNRCVLTMSVASALYWQQVRTHDERSERPLLTTGAYSRWAWRAPSTDNRCILTMSVASALSWLLA